jgi:hypothetical protein
MNEVTDELRCGECGCRTFTLLHKKPIDECRVGGQGSDGFEGTISAVCTQCRDETEISVVPAKLNTDGNLCGGWRGK